MEELLNLPDESLLLILRCLHYQDIVSVSSVNKRLHGLCMDGTLWKWQCQHYFLSTDLDDQESWKERFISLFNEYGRYRCYREIRKAWWKIEKFLKVNCPNVLLSLQGGVTEEELAAAEERMGARLPDDIRVSLRIHNGQDSTMGVPGVMGGHMISTHVRTYALLNLSKMETAYQSRGILQGCTFIATDAGSGLPTQFVACTDAGGFTQGRVYALVMGHTGIQKDFFVTADSFQHWLCDYAEKLEEHAYHVEKEHVLRFYHERGCVDGNIGITVKPTTVFVPEMSSVFPPNYFFAYRIMIEMSADTTVDLSCQLDTRYWHITDANGKEEEVRGPGVVGEYPVMKPGVKYAWISCTTFETTTGQMTGSFQFRNLRTGDIVDVPCPVFRMKAPPYLTSAERERILQTRCKSYTGSNRPQEEHR